MARDSRITASHFGIVFDLVVDSADTPAADELAATAVELVEIDDVRRLCQEIAEPELRTLSGT